MGRLEAGLGLGWGVGAFAGGYLVNEDDYGLGSAPVVFSFFFTAFLGLISVIGYMSSTERKREIIELKGDFLVYFKRLSR